MRTVIGGRTSLNSLLGRWPARVLGISIVAAQCLFASCTIDAAQPPELSFAVSGFAIEGDNPLTQAHTDGVLAPYLGEHTGLDRLLEAAKTLEQAMIEREYSFYRVVVPPQSIADGRVQLKVVSFTLGRVGIEGNEFFSIENIRRALPSLIEARSPNTRQLARERLHANRHPDRKLELRFTESEALRSVNAAVEVQDQRPYRVFALVNNTGNDETGKTRASVGFQHTNVFDLDHALTLTYTRSPEEFRKVRQYGGNYIVPLYSLGGTLGVFYTRSDVDTGTIGDFFDVSGAGEFFGVSYTHHLRAIGAYVQNLGVSIEDREFENRFEVTGLAERFNVRSRPLSLSYSAEYGGEAISANGFVSYARNIPVGRFNDKRSYQANRFGADHVWDVLRFGAGADFTLPYELTLRSRLNAQVSNEPLISGEQFGAGGARSVRGYDERAVAGDSGFTTSAELWSPRLPGGFRALGFVDFGLVRRKSPAAGELRREQLAGAGLGLRWYWKSNVGMETDLGVALTEAGQQDAGDLKAHISVFARY